jgi:predicted transposase YbfD/YdcC
MDEDACRIRQKNSTENLVTVRYVVLNLLKVELKEKINKRIEVTTIEK